MRQQTNKTENGRANPETINWDPQIYNYAERTGNLKAEAVGVVSGEKHFPVFEGRMVFKPLTKSKPLSTPLFAYAEVFWSWVIDAYFIPAPQYQLALCRGYEAECGKYYDYGTVSPMIYEEGEHLLNLLEFFRAYPDDKVQIDDYLNYCQMFYDYTEILEADYFQKNREIAENLAMQILISVLKGDQNYHYENIAFVCNASGQILRLAPMIDHEFSTCFMFPDNLSRHNYWFGELQRSIEGKSVRPEEYKDFPNEKERRLMEKSATCLYRNLIYIKEHYPEVTATFLENVSRLKRDLLQKRESFFIQKAKDYPDYANSDAYLIGKARYKDHDEEKAAAYEKQYGNPWSLPFKGGDFRIKDADGDGKLTDKDRVVKGTQQPKTTFGLTLSAGWKNFDLSVFMQGVTGTNRYFSRDVVGSFIGDTSHPSTNWLDAWTPENTNAEWPRLFLEENSISSPQRVNSSFWCMNTNYLRIKNVNLGYTLPKSWTNKLGIANAKIYYTGENLFTFDSLPFNADPESPSGNLDVYPISRSHSFGINVTF